MSYHPGSGAHTSGVGIWDVAEDRDASRAAAERSFLMQSLPPRGRPGRGQRSRRPQLRAIISRARRAAA